MKEWTTACPDWERRIKAGRSLIPCKPLFPDQAEEALEIFKALRIVDAPGRPTFGEAGDALRRMFGPVVFPGAVERADKRRTLASMRLGECVAK